MVVTDPDFPALNAINAARRLQYQTQAAARLAAGEQPNITAAGNDRISFTDIETGLSLSMLLSNLNITVATGPVQNGPIATGVAATDTANIASFIAATSPGDHLIFPPGEYVISTAIQLLPDRHYSGAGAKGSSASARTSFKAATGANLESVVASATWFSVSATPTSAGPIEVDNICFDGNRDNQASGSGHGLVTMNYQSSFIECKFANTRGDGFRLSTVTQAGNTITNTCNEPFIVRCQFINNGGDSLRVFEGSSAKFTDGNLLDCIFQGGGDQNGIVIDKGSGWQVRGNHVYANPMNGIKIGDGFQTSVTGNYVEGFGFSTTVGTYMGINMSASGITSSSANIVTGNKIWAGGSTLTTGVAIRGIGVTAANNQTAFVSITGNVLYGRTFTTTTSGIQVNANNAGATITASVSGNLSTGWDTPYAVGTTGVVNIEAAANAGALVPNETFGATPAINVGKAAVNGVWRMILTGNASPTIQDGLDGQTIVVQWQQDGTGSRTLTWPANVVGGPTITSTANVVTMVFLTYIASTDVWYAK